MSRRAGTNSTPLYALVCRQCPDKNNFRLRSIESKSNQKIIEPYLNDVLVGVLAVGPDPQRDQDIVVEQPQLPSTVRFCHHQDIIFDKMVASISLRTDGKCSFLFTVYFLSSFGVTKRLEEIKGVVKHEEYIISERET